MHIGLVGGTGGLGRALALRWSRKHDIAVGSRSREGATDSAANYSALARAHYGSSMKGSIEGMENKEAIASSDVVVLTIHADSALQYLVGVRSSFKDREIVVTPIVPLVNIGGHYEYRPPRVLATETGGIKIVSMAQAIADLLANVRVVSALHTVPAARLANFVNPLSCDVLVSGDDLNAVYLVSSLIREVEGLRPLAAGPLSVSHLLETILPLLLNTSSYSSLSEPALRMV